MLDFIKGTLKESHPQYVIIDWMGLGIKVQIPASLYFKAPPAGGVITLFTHLHVKDDGINIYGFLNGEDRNFFKVLLGVSGIGPKLALSLMGHLTLSQLYSSISREEIQVLTNVPGIGQKTARRLVYELKEKLDFDKGAVSPVHDEELEVWKGVEEALLSLGYSATEITVVKNKLKDITGLQMEDLFRKALVLLGK
ncbi:MAG: Holliday junction branch migration protein RuvA [Firmicutes bacterium]|nr:Holliday junction branch migration protein RuvA [Bacillota bacterium]